MTATDAGWAVAFAIMAALAIGAAAFWLTGLRERRKLKHEKKKIDQDRDRIAEQEVELARLIRTWSSRKLTDEEIYQAMDAVSRMVEEREITYFSVLDFVNFRNSEGDSVQLDELLEKFNVSHTTMTFLCTELRRADLLQEATTRDDQVQYAVTNLGKDVVDRTNSFFCFVTDQQIMMRR